MCKYTSPFLPTDVASKLRTLLVRYRTLAAFLKTSYKVFCRPSKDEKRPKLQGTWSFAHGVGIRASHLVADRLQPHSTPNSYDSVTRLNFCQNHFRAFRSLPYYKRPQEVQPQTSSARLCPAGLEGAGAAGTWGLLSGNSLVYSGKASKPAHADRKHRAQESVLQAAREAASSANRHLLLGYRRKTRTPPLVPQAAFCLELSRQLHRQSLICSITNQVTPRSAFSTEPQQRDLAALPPPTLRLPPPGAAHAPAVPSSRRAGQWPAGQRCQKMAAARARGHRGRHRRAGERPGRFVWR